MPAAPDRCYQSARATVTGHDLAHERSKCQTLLRDILQGGDGRGEGQL